MRLHARGYCRNVRSYKRFLLYLFYLKACIFYTISTFISTTNKCCNDFHAKTGTGEGTDANSSCHIYNWLQTISADSLFCSSRTRQSPVYRKGTVLNLYSSRFFSSYLYLLRIACAQRSSQVEHTFIFLSLTTATGCHTNNFMARRNAT